MAVAVWRPTLGAVTLGDGRVQFRLWAPKLEQVQLHITHPEDRLIDMQAEGGGYFQAVVDGVEPGTRYFYRVNGQDRPDPASRFQPDGVHTASEVVSSDFDWHDSDWRGIPLRDTIFYELHVGTFTTDGTFDAIIPCLDRLKALGITAIELMPIAEFPGSRNWGYDGVYTYAPESSYGGPDGLRRLVDACHQRGLAVVLDVVYNHFGPEGNYNQEYGEYFCECYSSPWGSCLNFDQTMSDDVRRFFIENALYWFSDFHIDDLRLDATHAIMDFSSYTFLQELSERVGYLRRELQREIHLIAENAKNDARTVRPLSEDGLGMDAQWNDDFHHALRTLMTGDQTGYYQDYGSLEHLAKAYREGFYFSGQFSHHMGRRFGTSSVNIPAERLVVFTHNHDQVGNRAYGERLRHFLSFDELKLAAGVTLLSPYLPLLFMGEEYDETAPFLYFIDFRGEDLVEGVRSGRKEEFAPFIGDDDDPPDPKSEETFNRSKLTHSLAESGHHRTLWRFYQTLIALRKTNPVLQHLSKEHMEVTTDPEGHTLTVRRWHRGSETIACYNFGSDLDVLPVPDGGEWSLLLDSSADAWSSEQADGGAAEQPSALRSNQRVSVHPKSFVLIGKSA